MQEKTFEAQIKETVDDIKHNIKMWAEYEHTLVQFRKKCMSITAKDGINDK